MSREGVIEKRDFHLTMAEEQIERVERSKFGDPERDFRAATAGVHAQLAAVYQQQLAQEAP